MSDIDGLAAFLAARYDEAEAVAQAAGGPAPQGEWAQVDPERRPGRIDCDSGYVVTYDEGSPDAGQAAHIALNDPAAKLRDIAAKRAIVARYQDMHWHAPGVPGSKFPDMRAEDTGACRTCVTNKLFATEFSDHPDYKAEWAP